MAKDQKRVSDSDEAAPSAGDSTQTLRKAKPLGGARRARGPAPAAREAEVPVKKKPRKAAPAEAEEAEDADVEAYEEREPFFTNQFVKSSMACLFSMAMHLVILLVLGLMMLPAMVQEVLLPLTVNPSIEETEELTAELDMETDASTETEATAQNFSETVGAMAGGAPAVSGTVSIDTAVSSAVSSGAGEVSLEMMGGSPKPSDLVGELPPSTKGDARAIVDNMDHAMDRITQELLLLMSKSKVLAIWAFDQSESMKDDQKEIRSRIDRVYRELGLHEAGQGDVLTTAVVSYGQGFAQHTENPTFSVQEIKDAIDEVPIDATGKEMMCSAVGTSIGMYQSYAKRGNRKMAMILVTDETGEREDNEVNLEAAIHQAREAGCSIYILGREAVFGYPYAHFRWVHPQTGHHHWLPVDRGPETAFVETLQTNGFTKRYDAHSSGFGPYEQSRMALETNGIFFMLPSVESNLVRGETRRYDLEQLRPYHPDLRARQEQFADRDASILRTGITKIIYDLNPYNEEIAKWIVMRMHFSPDPQAFAQQVAREHEKAKVYISYLDMAAKALESIESHRKTEYSPRWQANYDLLHGQLLAYKVRIYEYGAYLDWFMKNPKIVPMKKPPNLTLGHWDIRTRKSTITGELTAPFIEEANAVFAKVIKEHPGTPWASRAQIELNRGFGVELVEDYHGPGRRYNGPVTIPVPKL